MKKYFRIKTTVFYKKDNTSKIFKIRTTDRPREYVAEGVEIYALAIDTLKNFFAAVLRIIGALYCTNIKN